MGIDLRPLTSADDVALREFLRHLAVHSPSVLAYHDPFYLDLLRETGVGEPYSLGAFDGGQLAGVLPALIRRAGSGCVVASLPFFGPNAGVLCAEDGRADELHDRLLGAMLERLRGEPGLLSFSLQTPFRCERPEHYDRALPGALAVERFTQHLDLADAVWPAKLRYDLRRTEKLGVTVETAATPARLDEMYAMYADNCAEAGIAVKPRGVFDALATRGLAEGLADLRFAYHDGRMVSGLLTLFSAATASYYLPCTLREARPLQPATYLIDQAVAQVKSRGVRHWNWEGSPSRDSGVYQFKARWGSVESAYRTLILPFQPPEVFRALGRERIARDFPFFFVYPFHLL